MFSIFPHDKKLFISYSRLDAGLVEPLVNMLRAAKSAPVFLDQDNIPPGKQWRVWIARAINDADAMLVFWCGHSAGSEEVRKEYQAAIQANKTVIPALLDSTPLPGDLGTFQGIDLRQTVARSHAGPTGVQRNSGLQDADVHKHMARAIVRFLSR